MFTAEIAEGAETTKKEKFNGITNLIMNSGDTVSVMVNGMGATPLMELYILYKDAYEWLDSKGIHVLGLLTPDNLQLSD